MADAYAKARAADIVIGLSHTQEEQEAHQARYTLLKVREGQVGGEFPVYYNMDRMMISDLDHSATKRVQAEEGHQIGAMEDEHENTGREAAT